MRLILRFQIILVIYSHDFSRWKASDRWHSVDAHSYGIVTMLAKLTITADSAIWCQFRLTALGLSKMNGEMLLTLC